MKTWHWVAIGVGVVAAIYLYRSTGGGFARVAANQVVPPATGPAVESKRGVGHFVGAAPLVAAGPSVEAARGVRHF